VTVRGDALVLDTHVWKRYLEGSGVSARMVKRIDAAGAAQALYIAAITPWEVAMLAGQGKLELNGPTLQWIADAVKASGVIVHPLEPAIAVDAAELPVFHGDPADRMIVSTARYLGAILVTKDSKIHEWSAKTKGVRVLDP
jgi:PIN domain nuclease of toxin-antitoxin system